MSNSEQLRHSILLESESVSTRRRFGLFSHPLSTAICDNGPFLTKQHPRNEMGKPVTKPRNIYVSPNKQGKLNKSYFAPLNPLATHSIHDTFMQQGVRVLKEQSQSFNNGRKEDSFVPASGYKSIVNAAYLYKEQMNPELDPKRFKMEDNRVRTGPRNFFTNTEQKIIDTTFRPYKHLADPYEREHQIELQRFKLEKSKEREEPFKPNSFSPKLLAKDSLVYASDLALPKKTLNESLPSIYRHESAWRSSSNTKEGLNGYFLPVHRYIQNPPPERKPKQYSEKESFKGMSANKLSSPSPSITLNRLNLMPHLNRSFSPKH